MKFMTTFTPGNKIQAIKFVRENVHTMNTDSLSVEMSGTQLIITGVGLSSLGLKDAKDLVESILTAAPTVALAPPLKSIWEVKRYSILDQTVYLASPEHIGIFTSEEKAEAAVNRTIRHRGQVTDGAPWDDKWDYGINELKITE